MLPDRQNRKPHPHGKKENFKWNLQEEKIKTAIKCVVFGVEGIGKSTFASKFPNPVFIDTEGSTKHMDVARTGKPSSWTMLLDQVRYFKNNPGEFSTLIIDTADWAEQLCVDDICARAKKDGIEDFGFGKGYVYLSEAFGKLLNLLNEVIDTGTHVVLTAHAKCANLNSRTNSVHMTGGK